MHRGRAKSLDRGTRSAQIAGEGDALRRNRAKRSQSRDVRRIGRVRAKGLQQLKPGKTCFGSCRGKPPPERKEREDPKVLPLLGPAAR